MEQTKINNFLSLYGKKFFPEEKMAVIEENLKIMPDAKYNLLTTQTYTKASTTTILSIFFGALGIDRFMIGDVGLGVLKLVTAGGCGLWAFIDWFLVGKKTKEKNFEKLSRLF